MGASRQVWHETVIRGLIWNVQTQNNGLEVEWGGLLQKDASEGGKACERSLGLAVVRGGGVRTHVGSIPGKTGGSWVEFRLFDVRRERRKKLSVEDDVEVLALESQNIHFDGRNERRERREGGGKGSDLVLM